MRSVTVSLYCVVVVSADTFNAWLARSDGSMAGMSVADTLRYHIHFPKKGYRLSDAIHFLPDLKPKALKPHFSNQKEKLELVLVMVCGEILSVEEGNSRA